MDSGLITIMEFCTTESDHGRISFGEVVKKLMEAGIERYHTDFLRSEKIFYMPTGESHVVSNKHISAISAATFSKAGVASAIRAIQNQHITYQEFCTRIIDSGCVGYMVSMVGKCALYYGRTNGFHIEHFPNSQS